MKHSRKRQKSLPRSFSAGHPSSGPEPTTERSDTSDKLSLVLKELTKQGEMAEKLMQFQKQYSDYQEQVAVRFFQALMDRMSLSLDGVLDYLDLSEDDRKYCQELFEESEDPSDPED